VIAKHADAIGVAIVLNGKIEEVNVYPGHALLAKVYPRLVQSYALAAAAEKRSGEAPSATEVAKFMREGGEQKREKLNGQNEMLLTVGNGQMRCDTSYEGQAVHRQWMRKMER